MRTTVDIAPPLLKRLRDEAHRRGISFKEFLDAVLNRGLAARQPVKPAAYRCPTFSMGESVVPGIDHALAIAGALEDDEVARKLALRK